MLFHCIAWCCIHSITRCCTVYIARRRTTAQCILIQIWMRVDRVVGRLRQSCAPVNSNAWSWVWKAKWLCHIQTTKSGDFFGRSWLFPVFCHNCDDNCENSVRSLRRAVCAPRVKWVFCEWYMNVNQTRPLLPVPSTMPNRGVERVGSGSRTWGKERYLNKMSFLTLDLLGTHSSKSFGIFEISKFDPNWTGLVRKYIQTQSSDRPFRCLDYHVSWRHVFE